MNEKRKRRISDANLALVKATFADNDDLLLVMRRVILQLPLTIADVDIIKSNIKGKDDLKSLLSDMFNPQLRGDEPFSQVIDLWLTLEAKDKPTENVLLQVKAKKMAIDYIIQQLEYLFDLSTEQTIKFTDFTDFTDLDNKHDFDVHANIIARNFIVQHTEQQLSGLSMLAGTKTETVEETLARLEKNSTK